MKTSEAELLSEEESIKHDREALDRKHLDVKTQADLDDLGVLEAKLKLRIDHLALKRRLLEAEKSRSKAEAIENDKAAHRQIFIDEEKLRHESKLLCELGHPVTFVEFRNFRNLHFDGDEWRSVADPQYVREVFKCQTCDREFSFLPHEIALFAEIAKEQFEQQKTFAEKEKTKAEAFAKGRAAAEAAKQARRKK